MSALKILTIVNRTALTPLVVTSAFVRVDTILILINTHAMVCFVVLSSFVSTDIFHELQMLMSAIMVIIAALIMRTV